MIIPLKLKDGKDGKNPGNWEKDSSESVSYAKKLNHTLPADTEAGITVKVDPVNLNKASKKEIAQVNGLTPIAQDIIKLRKEKGRFNFYGQISDSIPGLEIETLRGLGEKNVIRLR